LYSSALFQKSAGDSSSSGDSFWISYKEQESYATKNGQEIRVYQDTDFSMLELPTIEKPVSLAVSLTASTGLSIAFMGGPYGFIYSFEIKDIFKGNCLTWNIDRAGLSVCTGDKNQQWLWTNDNQDGGILRPVSNIYTCIVKDGNGNCIKFVWNANFMLQSGTQVLTVERSTSSQAVLCEPPCHGIQHFFLPKGGPNGVGPQYSFVATTVATTDQSISNDPIEVVEDQAACERKCLGKPSGLCAAAVFKSNQKECKIITGIGSKKDRGNYVSVGSSPGDILLLPGNVHPYENATETVCHLEGSIIFSTTSPKSLIEVFAICDALPSCVSFSWNSTLQNSTFFSKRPITCSAAQKYGQDYFVHRQRYEMVDHYFGYPEKDVFTLNRISFDKCTA
jgi:hypothetical protein